MKFFDGLNVFQLSSYSFNNSGFNNLPNVEIHVFKNTNVKIEVEAVGDQLNVVNKPTKQYLEDNNHFRLHFKSVADFDIYSRDLTTSSIAELNFLFDILTKHQTKPYTGENTSYQTTTKTYKKQKTGDPVEKVSASYLRTNQKDKRLLAKVETDKKNTCQSDRRFWIDVEKLYPKTATISPSKQDKTPTTHARITTRDSLHPIYSK
jgi:hypothetical protein